MVPFGLDGRRLPLSDCTLRLSGPADGGSSPLLPLALPFPPASIFPDAMGSGCVLAFHAHGLSGCLVSAWE